MPPDDPRVSVHTADRYEGDLSMSAPESETEQPRAQFPEADMGGGRSGRGPATHVPGVSEPGGVLPPYDGRTESGEIDSDNGRGGPTTVDGLTSPVPEDTPGGRTASPADEQPAEGSADTDFEEK
jgi:hypothetical protein